MAELRAVAEATRPRQNRGGAGLALAQAARHPRTGGHQDRSAAPPSLGETRAAAEALSITILRAVFTRCSAALFDSDRDDERQLRSRMLAELFDLRKERA